MEKQEIRVFFKRYSSTGKFDDGRIRLDVYFKDSKANTYIWTPDWKMGTRSLFLEAYRVEKLNRPKGPEVERFRQTGKEVLVEDEEKIESYDEVSGYLKRLEKDEIVIHEPVYERGEFGYDMFSLIMGPSKARVRRVCLSIEFRAKIMGETGNLMNWVHRYKGCSGKWIIRNGELFDVEWEKTKEKEDD